MGVGRCAQNGVMTLSGTERPHLNDVELRLRIVLNSGQVITGKIGSGALGYTAIGEHVGMAQRMESIAPPGGVMLSVCSARLVGGLAELGEPELVQIPARTAGEGTR